VPHYYFNLKKEKKSGDAGESSWTPSTSLILALAEALRYIKQIGMPHLIENAQLLARATRAAVEALGLELFAPGSPGSSVTAVKAPAGMDSGVIVKEFRNRFGAIIANGQGTMKGQIFRVAHLGYFDSRICLACGRAGDHSQRQRTFRAVWHRRRRRRRNLRARCRRISNRKGIIEQP